MNRILVINTGSTSTKIAVFDAHTKVFKTSIDHPSEDIKRFPDLADQYPYRLEEVLHALAEAGISLSAITAIAARGGTFGYAEGGAYLVEENLTAACKNPVTPHPSNLSALIGGELAKRIGCKAYIYDAVCTNEVTDTARMTGVAGVLRRPFSHVLNTRAVARDIAARCGRNYADMNIVCAHLGGGISLNVHTGGRIVDVVSDDEGPMSPERAGRLNGKTMINLCFDGKRDRKQMQRLFRGEGGLASLLGTSDLREVERRINSGDENAEAALDAMAYEIAKDIGALATVVSGKLDCIAITGGAARCQRLTDAIQRRVTFLAPVYVYPGAMEMEALANGILRVLSGEETARIYHR